MEDEPYGGDNLVAVDRCLLGPGWRLMVRVYLGEDGRQEREQVGDQRDEHRNQR